MGNEQENCYSSCIKEKILVLSPMGTELPNFLMKQHHQLIQQDLVTCYLRLFTKSQTCYLFSWLYDNLYMNELSNFLN